MSHFLIRLWGGFVKLKYRSRGFDLVQNFEVYQSISLVFLGTATQRSKLSPVLQV